MAALLVGVATGVATGVLKPLVGKLVKVLGDQCKGFTGVRSEMEAIIEELEAMHAFLLEMSKVENPDEQDKAWTKKVRELSYDMEDSIDKFILHVDGKSADPRGLINKFKCKMSKLKAQWKFAKEFEKFKIQIKGAAETNERYKDPGTIKNASKLDVDSRALAIFEDASKLVGIDRPKAELIKLLEKKECASSQKTKVISIFGSGGLGKTTLASQVYQELKGQFKCAAFLSVSRSPDMTKILRTILSEASNQPYGYTEAGGDEQLIWKIRENLQDKRYLFVIDDIWKEDIWEIINSALLKNSKHSRIIITTRMHHVARASCSSDGDIVHEMKPLNSAESKKLFLERLFDSDGNCPAHLVDISDKILKKCDGVPLAIISISGLLANKPKSKCEWDRVLNSIGRGRLGSNPDAQSLMQILSLSYFDLTHHLKTCLLYLSIFPEDSVIDKWRLVRRWIAEGFIHEQGGNALYELGERCFIELINRSLIQAKKISKHGEVTACQVHDTILDFIVQKSKEENFVTVFDDDYKMHSPGSKVRRLSIHASSQEKVSKLTELDLSHVRSVTLFDYSVEFPMWSKFGFLRVLDLQGCKQVESHHLAAIENLFQLKYLSLRETRVCQLPEHIGKLQFLETMELKKSNVATLPASVAKLLRLAYLAVDKGVKLPDEAGSMTALEDLDCVDISKQSICFIQELGQLKNLRNVSLFLCLDDSSNNAREFKVADILVLGRLPALVFLQVVADDSFEIEGRSLTIQGSDGFHSLRQFDFLCSVPVKFEVGAMPALEKLTLMFLFTSVRIDQLLVGNGDFPLGIQYLSSLESAYYVVCYRNKAIHDWIEEKIIQMEKKGFSRDEEMSDMIYTLAVATCSLLLANLNQNRSTGATSASKTAVHSHPKFRKLMVSHRARWKWGSEKEEKSPYNHLYFIQRTIPKFLHCNKRPKLLGTEDKELFSMIISTWLEGTSDTISLRLIQDSTYTTIINFVQQVFELAGYHDELMRMDLILQRASKSLNRSEML